MPRTAVRRRSIDDYAGRHKTEEYQRCRYYPDCEIHQGKLPALRAQSEVGAGERQDIRAEYANGTPRPSIAEAHRLTYTAVLRITQGQRNRERVTS
jgi:hypothetical protein